jgi:NAD(P)H dehydrogenase (quinone)
MTMSNDFTIFVTGATGQLGHLVIQSLLKKVAPNRIFAGVRSLEKGADLAALGINLRVADYSKPETLKPAFAGIDRVLLISSSEIGQRTSQHTNVIEAAKAAGVAFIAYTSLLGGNNSPLHALKGEHVATEDLLQASGIPFTVLRNGWYIENYNGNIGPALQYGAISGASGEGKIAAAARADYAEAAATVVAAAEIQNGKIYELAGDEAFTMAGWAATLAEVSGKPVVYNNLSEADYAKLLVSFGLPEGFATVLAESDTGASKGGLFDGSKTLSALIGRPTTSLKAVLSDAVKA